MTDSRPPMFSIRCYCAAASLLVEAEPRSVVNCHCGQCRRLSGAAFTTWVSFPSAALTLTGGEPLGSFAVTSNVTRHFCRTCGSHVYTADTRLPTIFGVPAGVIEGDSLPPPRAHYFVDHRAAWHAICDDRPQFGGESGMSPTS